MSKIAELLERMEKRQTSQQATIDTHELILNGHPQGDIPGLIQRHKKVSEKVDLHEEFIKKKKWKDDFLKVLGGVVGGGLITLAVELLKMKI